MSNRFTFISALAAFCFTVAPLRAADPSPLRPWTNYQTIMWIGDTAAKQLDKLPLFYQRLRDMGINTAMAYGDANPQPLLDQGFPYYVENVINKGLCLKFHSKVTDWNKFVTTWTKAGRSETAFVRDYSLDDPAWRSWACGEMKRVARQNAPHSPLAYDIRDELSTTISANPFDYDFSPITLGKFREWLKTQYKDLAALNAEWETKFATWDEVKPFTTDQIKNRMASGDAIPRGKPDWQAVQRIKFDPAEARKNPTRWNFSPWCDFRTYMDLSLASALDDIRQASHAGDSRTPVGIEGTQMPSAWGGYDLWRLSQVLDWIEPYDIGNAREILGSFMPGKPMVTTVFEKDTDHARRRLWHLLLEGDRGCIIWWSEDCIDWKSPDYALTPKAKALAPVLKEMTSPLAQLFLRAEKEYDPIAIHYSQPSIQVDWLLESTVDGSTWHRRFSSFEADHNRMAKVRNGWVKAFQDLGFSPRFISSSELENIRWPVALPGVGAGLLVLPQSYALSEAEVRAIQNFERPGMGGSTVRYVFTDGSPGLFDEHGQLRRSGPWVEPYPLSTSERMIYRRQMREDAGRLAQDISRFPATRLASSPDQTLWNWLQKDEAMEWLLARRVVTLPPESRVRIHRFKIGEARLLAFERNIDYHMSEDLKQAGGNEALEKPAELEAWLTTNPRVSHPAHVYDLRAGKYLGQIDRIAFHLDPWQPSLFALLPEKVAEERIVESLLAAAAGK